MKSRLFLIIFLLLTITASCSRDKEKFRLEGSISNISQAEFFLYSPEGAFEGMDTLHIEGGSFVYERKLTEPAILTLLYPNFSQTYIVAEPGKKVKIKGEAAKLGEADITGTDDNELLTTFRKENASRSERDARLAANHFIRSHPKTMAAMAVYLRYFAQAEKPDATTTRDLLDVLTKAQPQNKGLKALEQNFSPLIKAAPGNKLGDYSFTDTEGKKVSRADFSGRPMIIAFWAEWTPDSHDLAKTLKRIRRTYGERIGILSVSLDTDLNKCRLIMRHDSVPSPVIFDGKGPENAAAGQLGMRYVPGWILVDKNGYITARDLKNEDLERLVQETVR